MNCAILGCGYVADFYMATRAQHPELNITSAFDIDQERLLAFSSFHKLRGYLSFDELLNDPAIDLVLNLTNPRSHYETTKACLNAGKHVYSEKPLAMDSQHAFELANLAQAKSLALSSAPCSLLSETAQTLWKGVHDGVTGPVRLVYATFDDGMIHRHHFRRWKSSTGAPWPAQDEFEVGCTYEHAAYVLSWLVAIFGPVRRINAYASTRILDKGVQVGDMAPDFTVGCLEFDNDVVARVTCSVVAPLDKSIQIIGERGTLYTKFVRNDASPVYFEPATPNRFVQGAISRLSHYAVQLEQFFKLPYSASGLKFERKYPYAIPPRFAYSGSNKPVDFLRGPAELVNAVAEQRPCRLSAELGAHLVEVIETLQFPERFEAPRSLETSFPVIAPLQWS